jgi:glutathione S-transferase
VTVNEPAAPTSGPLFHLALPDDWATATTTGEYRMSTRGMTLDDVGFIHCSTADQVAGTAARFYGDLDQLVVLTIDPAMVPSPVVFEPPAPGVDELFPHIYGPLPVEAVSTAAVWTRPADGAWSDPPV